MSTSEHQLSTIAQPWTAPVSVRGHSWPTFSLFLPVQSSLFLLPWADFFVSSSVQNAKRVSIILEWPMYTYFQSSLNLFIPNIHNNVFKKSKSLGNRSIGFTLLCGVFWSNTTINFNDAKFPENVGHISTFPASPDDCLLLSIPWRRHVWILSQNFSRPESYREDLDNARSSLRGKANRKSTGG